MRSAAVHPHTWTFVLLGFGIVGATLVLSQFLSWTAIVALVCFVALCSLIVLEPLWGAYGLAFLAPMSGFVIDFSRDQSLSRLPYIGGINAPLVDLFAITVLLLLSIIFLIRPQTLQLRGLGKFSVVLSAFYIAVACSVLFADPLFFGTTVKAFFRPYLFMYVAFAIPLIVLLKKHIDQVRVLFAYEVAAVLGALMGLISLITQHVVGFVRATPFAIGGYTPFGVNHNVLGESLTAIIPFAWWFAFREEIKERRTWLVSAASMITAIAILTFSRAAWIVLAAQAVLYLWWRYGKTIHRKKFFVGVAVAAGVLAIFFALIQSTFIADSSDSTRKDLLGIAITYWQRAPWFGQGPGMYVPIVGETVAFRMDYGSPMDAHGVVQKLLLETGLVGTALFFGFLFLVGRALWRRRENEFHFMLFVTFVSLWGYQLFNTGYFDGKVWVLLGIIIASLL